MKLITTLIMLLSLQTATNAQTDTNDKMQWFNDAKLGIFIHWGVYAVDGTRESWAFFRGEVPYDEYMNQAERFTARNYNPEKWAILFKEAGARYAVLTTKHHDGMALWDTKMSDLNVVKKTPAGRDLVGPYCDALRKHGLKVGLYFSHLDWSHPDYASIAPPDVLFKDDRNPYAYPPKGKEDILKWESFLKFHRGQLHELMINYQPDLLWFDGAWERSNQQWKMKELRDSIFTWKDDVIVNSRLSGYGDYETPEQALPITKPDEKWELCMTLNRSWGYRQSDTNYKSPREIIRTFTEVFTNGGNLLLDVGPMEDGTIPDEQVFRLKELGSWISKHEEAVYPVVAGLPEGHFYGPTALSPDSTTIYLYLFNQPVEYIALKGIKNKIKSISVVGTGETLKHKISGGANWLDIPGIIQIDVPEKQDKYTTVIAVNLEKPLELYHGPGYVKHKD